MKGIVRKFLLQQLFMSAYVAGMLVVLRFSTGQITFGSTIITLLTVAAFAAITGSLASLAAVLAMVAGVVAASIPALIPATIQTLGLPFGVTALALAPNLFCAVAIVLVFYVLDDKVERCLGMGLVLVQFAVSYYTFAGVLVGGRYLEAAKTPSVALALSGVAIFGISCLASRFQTK